MPLARIESAIPASERPQTYTLESAATRIGAYSLCEVIKCCGLVGGGGGGGHTTGLLGAVFSIVVISRSWWGNRKEGDRWGDLGVDEWIILEWITRRWDVGMWTGLG